MDNQHRLIKGYRELSETEINLVNVIKDTGSSLEELIDQLLNDDMANHRWISIGKTHLQLGLMALTRAVIKPTFF